MNRFAVSHQLRDWIATSLGGVGGGFALWDITKNWSGSHQDNGQNGKKNSLVKMVLIV